MRGNAVSVEEIEVFRGSKDSVVVELSSLVGLSELKKDMEFFYRFSAMSLLAASTAVLVAARIARSPVR